MSKELEEIKSIVAIHFGALGFLNPIENEQILKDRDKVLNALNRLESIDNANPSEALKWIDKQIDWNCKKIEELKNRDKGVADIYDNENKMLVTIKQALQKAEQDKKKATAWDIVISKNVDMLLIKKYDNVSDYNSAVWLSGREKLTEEEFDLLKEVLG